MSFGSTKLPLIAAGLRLLAAAAVIAVLPSCSYMPQTENRVSANTSEVKSTATIRTNKPERRLDLGN
jgi:hypothetical protein